MYCTDGFIEAIFHKRNQTGGGKDNDRPKYMKKNTSSHLRLNYAKYWQQM